MNRWIGRDHVAGDPSQQGSTGPYQNRQSIEQRHDQRSSRDDQGNADREAEDQQRNAAIGRGGDRDHVVEAHHDVGDRHDLHRGPQMRRGFYAFLILFLRHQQFRGDHDQRQSADQLEVRQFHQRHDDTGEDDAQDDGNAGTQDHAPKPLARLQSTARQRDHQRVVA